MSAPRLTVVGDALLDRDIAGPAGRLCPDAPVPVIDEPEVSTRPGGAGLAAVLAARDGADVTLVTPIADDPAADELLALVRQAGVRLAPLAFAGTTAQKVRIRAGEQSVARLDYGRPGDVGPLTDEARSAIAEADAVLVSDYGRGATRAPTVRAVLGAGRRPVVWDPHPRGAEPVAGARLVTPNQAEAAQLASARVDTLADLSAVGAALLARWGAAGVAITRGAQGALLVAADGTPLVVPARSARGGDPCGAGDRFATAAAVALARGALLSEAVVKAVAAASAFVAAGGAAAVAPTAPATATNRTADAGDLLEASPAASDRPADARDLIARVRSRGGTVVATGGCFDLLHAGHVRMLTAARELGDCLVVCINSDASVRRLKGRDRPVVPQEDRQAVLSSLACVDAVVVFDEDTPERLLADLRPDVWAKGADYAVADLPEAPLVASWGGQAVVLPYLNGRSTTGLLEEATRRAHT